MSDLISRQAVEDAVYEYSRSCYLEYAQIMEYIDKIPSVSTEKTGQWIHTDECDEEWQFRCSVCNMPSRSNNHHYCSHCGSDMFAKMVEPQESEEEE